MEQEPDFEDDKIKIWKQGPADGDIRNDPTVLHINTKTEAPYESRVYRVAPTPEILTLVVDTFGLATASVPAPEVALDLASRFVNDAVVKLLSKRNTESGHVSLLIVGYSLGRRVALRPLRAMSEADYRAKIARFEKEWVEQGPLISGPVIAPDEWGKYQR